MTALLIAIIFIPFINVFAEGQTTDISKYQSNLDDIVNSALAKSGTPGAAVAIVDSDGVQIRSYGYVNKELNIQVSPDTLFELGSMSKAYTALGILYLEQEGKLKLTDHVKDYIPWLTLNFSGTHKGQKIDGEVPVTIENVLYQTTGIPFKTIGYIPEGNSDDMLDKTVRTLVGTDLDFYPGTKYSYATINYDILGLIIQEISGQSFENFITEKILTPLGLNNTYVNRQDAEKTGLLAAGYKTQFLYADIYNAPDYRGNTPAGYVISSANDMARWMQIQMGIADVPQNFKDIIVKSHMGNSTVASSGNFYYASGWNVHIRGTELKHGGSNPNFSSMIKIDNELNIGFCVLSNQNSNAVAYISDNFFNLLYGYKVTAFSKDNYQRMDIIFSIVCVSSAGIGIFYFVLLIFAVIDILLGKRIREKLKGVKVAGILLALPIMVFFGYCIYYLPNILLERLPWDAVNVWGSISILYGSISAFFAGTIFFMYVLLSFNFPKPKEKNYIALIPLSIINGLTSALIIFTINESFNRNLEYSKELLVYFVFALTFFIYTLKLVQGRMIVIANEIAYEKRVSMIDKIINSSYQAIEKIGSARIYSGLNNDTGAVAKIPGIVTKIISDVLTLIFCLAYLLSDSLAAFIASVAIIALNTAISFVTNKIARKYWEKNRDIQDIYFGQMSDLVYGFKELILNKLRRFAFWKDMKDYSRLSAELSKEAAVKFLNFRLYNGLTYNIIFGVVVFVFPLFIIGISANDLRQTLFMVFYLIGPFGSIMNIIPEITQVRINLRRIDKLILDLDEASAGYSEQKSVYSIMPEDIKLRFDKINYSYTSENKETGLEDVDFTLGPIDAEIKTGEITYIVGGNGSGKSTLGKLITGLYLPQSGKIFLNGQECGMADLNECFSAVYSDFYLFKKLYGIDVMSKRNDVQELLRLMKIEKRIEIDESGEIKSLNLSTGQRKRLAFIVCCLDEKPFMLFDEWAAEQDPEFRHYFYTELLPKLKEKGKGIVVITHDDRFFSLADQIIKLERGAIA